MKQLRILTGAHAGAQIRLIPGEYRIGREDGADICVIDWRESPVVFSLDAEGVLRWRQAPAQDAEPTVTLIPDLIPIPFGDVVLAVGPEDDAWPSDVDLLRMLWIKPEPAAHVKKNAPVAQRRTLATPLVAAMLGLGMLGALFVTGAALFGAPREAEATPDPRMLEEQLANALRTAGATGLKITPEGAALVVSGMVSNAAEDVAARGVFDQVVADHSRVVRHYDVAERDCRSIKDAIGIAGVHVLYRGHGVFEISGAVPSLTEFRTALARAKNDLDQNVERIDVSVTETPSSMPEADYSEVISIAGVRYVETPDGVKHLYPQGETRKNSPTAQSDQ